MLRQASARPEQVVPNPLTFIARDAIRAASLAPNADAALDVAGDALAAIAEAARRPLHAGASTPPNADIALRLTKAMQRACLLFSLIESACGELADLNHALVLSQVGHELMTAAAGDLEQLLDNATRGGAHHD